MFGGGTKLDLKLDTNTIPEGGTLSGTLTRSTNGAGIATFNDLSINLTGQKVLVASSGTLDQDASATFSIIAVFSIVQFKFLSTEVEY